MVNLYCKQRSIGRSRMSAWYWLGWTALAILCIEGAHALAADTSAAKPTGLTIVVMDPLAKPLSCPCVRGYAQRDYDELGNRLEKELKRPVRVVYNESLVAALKGAAKGQAQLVIGKCSVVKFDANRAGLDLQPFAKLTDQKGGTTITGMVVVPTNDPAKSVADLNGYRIVFGPVECDEKHAAAIELLKKNGISLPAKLETSAACSDGACSILENVKTQKGAAVISSYARPLLEGCGTVPKGSLRLLGQTAAVPFVQAFVNEQMPQAEREHLVAAVLHATHDPLLRIALETRDGFVPLQVRATEVAKKSS
jgi:ABC-type phosphate/phosphonate transport system substrate-binding protein